MKQETFPKVKGCKFYLVGGCVRDKVRGQPFNDYDYVVVTTLTFDELVKSINEMPNSRVYLEKKEFLTIRCKIDGHDCDVAFPRKDSDYTDGRHPDKVDQVGSLKEDASRRDFRMNAMYMDEYGEIIDFFGGKQDIDNKVICTVGSPTRRFAEDYLRVLRALRFSIQLGFKIDLETEHAIQQTTDNLKNISMERIKGELNKCFLIDARCTLKLLDDYCLWYILEYHKLNIGLNSKKVK